MTGEEIAQEFELANREAVDYVLGPAREHWELATDAEGWPVGVTARHIALGHELVLGWTGAIREGGPITGVDRVDAANAEEAARGVVASPEEVAQALRDGGSRLSAALRALGESELAREVTFGGRRLPAEMVAHASVRHIRSHLDSIRRTVEAVGQD